MRITHIKTIVTDKSDYQLRFKRMAFYTLWFALTTVIIGFITMKWYFFVLALIEACATMFAERDKKEVSSVFDTE